MSGAGAILFCGRQRRHGEIWLVHECARALTRRQYTLSKRLPLNTRCSIIPSACSVEQLLELPDEPSPAVLQDTLAAALHRYQLSDVHAMALTMLLGGAVEESRVAPRETQGTATHA